MPALLTAMDSGPSSSCKACGWRCARSASEVHGALEAPAPCVQAREDLLHCLVEAALRRVAEAADISTCLAPVRRRSPGRCRCRRRSLGATSPREIEQAGFRFVATTWRHPLGSPGTIQWSAMLNGANRWKSRILSPIPASLPPAGGWPFNPPHSPITVGMSSETVGWIGTAIEVAIGRSPIDGIEYAVDRLVAARPEDRSA